MIVFTSQTQVFHGKPTLSNLCIINSNHQVPVLMSQLGTNLVPSWYQLGTKLVPTWYQLGTNLVPTWYKLGTNLVPTWYQFGTKLVPTWYQLGTNLVPMLREILGEMDFQCQEKWISSFKINGFSMLGNNYTEFHEKTTKQFKHRFLNKK